MKTEFRESFVKDLKSVMDHTLHKKLKTIIENVEQVDSPDKIAHLKKLKGSSKYFRIKLGDYRIGMMLENDKCIFVRFLNRKDIYKHFP